MLNCKDSNTKYKPIDIRRNPYNSFDYEDLKESNWTELIFVEVVMFMSTKTSLI